MATTGAEGRRWSDLPDLFLNLVARRLSLVDHMRFGLVCKSWRSVAIGSPPCRRPPWLLARSLDRREFVCYSFWEDRTIRFLVPSELSGWDCCAASHGWLFMAGTRLLGRELFLLNPVTNALIDLPTRPPRIEFLGPYGALSSDPATAAARGDRAIVVLNYLTSTFICRVGDKHWTLLCRNRTGTHVAFHKGLLHMTGDPDTLVVHNLDYIECRFVPRWFEDKLDGGTCYLIQGGLEGADLLQVIVEQGRCIVLELVGGKDGSLQRWVRMKKLGGGALFVSRGHSELLSADICATMGMEGDCVYELDRSSVLWKMSMKDGSKAAAIPYLRQATVCSMLRFTLWFSPSIPSPLNRRKRDGTTENSLSFKEKKTRGGRNIKDVWHFNGQHSHHTDSVEMRSNKAQKAGTFGGEEEEAPQEEFAAEE